MNELERFYENFPTVKFAHGENIVSQDEVPEYVYAIKSGVVETYNFTDSGDRRCVSFSVISDIFPIEWVFSISTKSLFFQRAYTDCELYKIDRNVFQEEVASNQKLQGELLLMSVRDYVGAKLQLDALGKSGGYKKVLYILRFFCLGYGVDAAKNKVKIEIPLTHQEIANFCSLTRETTAIFIGQAKKRGVLTIKHKDYTVNTYKLNQEIDDEYNSGFSVNML